MVDIRYLIIMASSWKLFDDKLINAVRVKPVLYNNTLKEYRNNTVKDNAWAEVAAVVQGTSK